MRGVRRIAIAAVSLGALGAAGVALAADQEVVARDLRFNPARVALKPGETLTIRHDDGAIAHDLQFGDETSKRVPPGTKWVVQRTFTADEAREDPYVFFCSIHAGMRGFVYVNDTGTVPSPSPTPTQTPTPSPSATAAPTSTAAPGATPAPTAAAPGAPAGIVVAPGARLRSLRVVSRRSGVRIRIELSAPADVHGTLKRRAPGASRFERYGAVRFGTVAAGPRTLRLKRTTAGRRLKAGRYTLALRAAGARRTLRFRVL